VWPLPIASVRLPDAAIAGRRGDRTGWLQRARAPYARPVGASPCLATPRRASIVYDAVLDRDAILREGPVISFVLLRLLPAAWFVPRSRLATARFVDAHIVPRCLVCGAHRNQLRSLATAGTLVAARSAQARAPSGGRNTPMSRLSDRERAAGSRTVRPDIVVTDLQSQRGYRCAIAANRPLFVSER